jgi:hypothetical protein
MSNPLSSERVRTFWRDLQRLVQDRAKSVEETGAQRAAESQALHERHDAERKRLTQSRLESMAELAGEYERNRGQIVEQAESELKAAKAEHAKGRETALEQYQAEEESAHQHYKESRWTLDAVHEANVKKSNSVLENAQRQYGERTARAAAIRDQAIAQHRHWSLSVAEFARIPHSDESGSGDANPLSRADSAIATAEKSLQQFREMWSPRLLVGDRLLWFCFAVWAVIAASGLLMPQWYYGLIAATIAAPILGIALRYGLAARARSQARRIGEPLFRSLADVDRVAHVGERAAESAFDHAVAQSKQHLKDEARKAEIAHRKRLAGCLGRRDEAMTLADSRFHESSTRIEIRRTSELSAIDADYRSRSRQIEAETVQAIDREEAEFQERWSACQQKYTALESATTQAWETGRERLQCDLASIGGEADRLFPNWKFVESTHWSPPQSVPRAMRFGELAIDVAQMPGGQPHDGKLKPFEPAQFALPALLPFPKLASTLLHAGDAGRAAAVQTLQSMMLRFLTALPPGKVRFTIIDPVGLGENFASFMHLADHDEQLVTSRIWTEPNQIERRLTDLTAHMENVIQKYLRNQYKSIEEYNAAAGEVAEPYRVLIVANFPTNFSADTARRLVSIASSGAACGVYALVSVDSKQAMPQGFDLADLEQACTNLSWGAGQFQWEDADLGPLPLTIDPPPPPTDVAKIVHRVGELAKLAGKVEVDFSFIEPPRDQWWSADSRCGLRVPLGRAGATKRQYLNLGVGTAQHALVAGKTGSGKSTLLHALITNLALHYGPDEVELYLIDFKKGVEFKTYATHDLPHARVIAVESEREFGLSVLQRLDSELKRRGELFRMAGVQDIAAYREKETSLPRILLVVDEFQEFFVEDDKLSQEAALLLDRLVRQGRAFGLHVLLGSQTLGGAYSLARATIDQMAVRIALQCSEADANLILSKDNNAARLLSRPGEAIYNDANGLLEGNDIFQVVWLPEDRREVYLGELNCLAHEKHWRPPASTIIFEGNTPADIRTNLRLRSWIDAGGSEQPVREQVAWLGDALAIKEPTACTFRRQSGSNLLIIGQNGDAARAILTAAGVSLLFQPGGEDRTDVPAITILDGSTADDPDAKWFASMAERFNGDVQTMDARTAAKGLRQLGEELERRKSDAGAVHSPRFLIVYGLQRFRDLRRSEDDFGFGRRSENGEVNVAELLAELVREGPPLGMHVLVWCDTLVNVQRAFDRRDLREFEQRVLFQMGVTDSSTLIDSPAASRLGLNRALFATEELSVPEKFRPYRLPTLEWLDEAARGWKQVADRRRPLAPAVAEV